MSDSSDANDANDANIESLFRSFVQACPSFSTIKGKQEESSRDDRKDELDKKTIRLVSSNLTMGLKNSVISVIPVTETQSKNTTTIENGIEILPLNNTEKIYRKWKGGDIWGCINCNDRGDKWYMLKHPCKNNKR